MKKKSETSKIVTRKDTAWMPVPLTPRERTKVEKILTDAMVKKAELEAKLAALRHELSEEMTKAKRDISTAMKDMTVGRPQQVQIEVTKNFETNMMKTVRLDTGEVTEEREMYGWDKQVDMDEEVAEEDAA